MGNRLLAIMGIVAVVGGGCGQEDIKVYRVPKEQPPPRLPAEHPGHGPRSVPLTWTTPAGWQEAPPGAMRVASFKVTGPDGQQADVSVIPLAGGGGDDLSNVIRWRDQVGQPPVTAEELAQSAQAVTVAGQPALLYEVAGEGTRILAVIHRREGTAWFFKMTGSSELVGQQKVAFIEFVQGVRY